MVIRRVGLKGLNNFQVKLCTVATTVVKEKYNYSHRATVYFTYVAEALTKCLIPLTTKGYYQASFCNPKRQRSLEELSLTLIIVRSRR